jgi:hypothetical protein
LAEENLVLWMNMSLLNRKSWNRKVRCGQDLWEFFLEEGVTVEQITQ